MMKQVQTFSQYYMVSPVDFKIVYYNTWWLLTIFPMRENMR